MAAPMEGQISTRIKWKGEEFVQFSPSEWRSLVTKQVNIVSKDSKDHTGWVFTIDPVSKSVVLAQFPDEQRTVFEVIMGPAIDSVTLLQEPTNSITDRLNELFPSISRSTDMTEMELTKRKNDLKHWLEKHHIPVTLSGENGERLSIAGALQIEPPYGLENCVSANEIILGRVQTLIRSRPQSTDSTTVNETGGT